MIGCFIFPTCSQVIRVYMNSISRCKWLLLQSLSTRLILCFSFALFVIFRPSPVIESELPLIELSMAANKLKRSVLCINGVTNDRHFDKTCFAFMALTRGNICFAINLITKCNECSSVFNLSHYFYSFFCGDSSDTDPTKSLMKRKVKPQLTRNYNFTSFN